MWPAAFGARATAARGLSLAASAARVQPTVTAAVALSGAFGGVGLRRSASALGGGAHVRLLRHSPLSGGGGRSAMVAWAAVGPGRCCPPRHRQTLWRMRQ